MFYKSVKEQLSNTTETQSSKAFKVGTDPFLKPNKTKSFRISTQESVQEFPIRQKIMSKLNNPDYQQTVSFYQFLKDQTIQSCTEAKTAPSTDHSVYKDSQKYSQEKSQFRGYLQTSQKRFRGEPLTNDIIPNKQDDLDDYFSKQDKNKKIKPTRTIQLRNNQLIYEQQQKEIKLLTFRNFKKGEQNYFEQLKKLHTEGENNFLKKAQLRQKYYFDNLMPPQQQFVNSKDLYLIKSNDVEDKTDKFNNCWTKTESSAVQIRIKSMVDHNQQFNNILENIKSKDLKDQKINLPQEEKDFQNYVLKCFQLNSFEEIEELLKANQRILTFRDKNGRTPHMIAAVRGYKPLIDLLSIYNIDYSDTDFKGMTAKDLAKKAEFIELANYLQILDRKQSQRFLRQS